MLNHALSAVPHSLICCICFIWKGKERYLCLSLGLLWITLSAPSICKNIYIYHSENSCSHPVLFSLMAMRILRSLARYGDYRPAVTTFMFWIHEPGFSSKRFYFYLCFSSAFSSSTVIFMIFFLSMKNVIFPIQGNAILKNVTVIFPVQGNTVLKNVILSVDAVEKHKLA